MLVYIDYPAKGPPPLFENRPYILNLTSAYQIG
jgi:hypothetical protein